VTVKLLHIITYTYTYTIAKKMNHYTYRPLTHAYKIIKYQSTIGVGDGEGAGRAPAPKNSLKYLPGNHYVEFGHFSDKTYAIWIIFREIMTKKSGILIIFRARFTQNSGILLIFFYIFFFGQKCLSSYA